MGIEELAEDIRNCTICRDLPLGPSPLFKIHTNAKILIAGQAPGRKTHEKGRPFDDASGRRLREWLGISEDIFYNNLKIAILPMGLCYPGTGKNGDLPPRPECARAWRQQVLLQMQHIELTIIIGRYAIDWHLPESKAKSVTALTQAWQEYWPDHIVLPHPSPRNNRWLKRNPWFEMNILPILKQRVSSILMSS